MRKKVPWRNICISITLLLWPVLKKIIRIGGDLDFLGVWKPTVRLALDYSEYIMPAIGLVLLGFLLYPNLRASAPPQPFPEELSSPVPLPVELSDTDDRVFVDKDYLELSKICEGKTSAQSDVALALYMDKWTRPLQYVVEDVSVSEFGVSVSCEAHRPVMSLVLRFDCSYREHFEHRDPGYSFVAVGKINEVSRYEVELSECKLME